MSLLLAAAIGWLVAVGVLQLLRRDAIRVVLGLYSFWNAANLLVIGVAAVRGSRAPLAEGGAGAAADPVVQALVLTAIVITFGFTAFLLTMVYWLYRRGDSINPHDFDEARH